MVQPKKWLDEIIEVMIELGGHCHYRDLYDKIQERKIMEPIDSFEQTIQRTIQNYSSDSEGFKGKMDIFYSVEGKGKGHWGLKDYNPTINNVDITEDDEGFIEGKQTLKVHICYERNHRVVMIAKNNFKQKNDRLFCEICGFNFEKIYGDIGKDFIEGHHSIPVSEIPKGYKTKIEDIILVCSNCHKMLHRKRPWLNKDNFKKLINSIKPN